MRSYLDSLLLDLPDSMDPEALGDAALLLEPRDPARAHPASGRGRLLTCGDFEQNPGPSGGRGSLLTC